MAELKIARQARIGGSTRRGRGPVGLVLCAMVLGTLIGLAVLAAIPSQAGRSTGASDGVGANPPSMDLIDTTSTVDQTPGRTDDRGRKPSLRELNEARAQGRRPNVVEGANVEPRVTPPQVVKPHAPGVQLPGDLRLVLGGGKTTLTPGEEFEMQVVFEELERPLSAYTLEAVWDPQQVTVREVHGLKGGFPAPTQVNMAIPGTASWNGLDPQPSQAGEVTVATLRGRITSEATGSVRLYFTPRSITTVGTGRGLPGVPRVFTIPVE